MFPHPTADDEVVKPPNLSEEMEEGGERDEEEESWDTELVVEDRLAGKG